MSMSAKRKSTTELTHENWDKEDPDTEKKENEAGTFKTAPEDVLEKRVIRTAKRRTQFSSGDESKKSVFSGFGGFNKTQPSSFDFLANLTNGKTNGQPVNSKENNTSPFSSKPSTPISNAFNIPVTSVSPKSTFGGPSTQSSLFGGMTAGTSPLATFSSTVGSTPFKMQALSAADISDSNAKTTNSTTISKAVSSIFGTSTPNSDAKPAFSLTPNNPTTFENKPISFISTSETNPSMNTKSESANKDDTLISKTNDDKKHEYYAKLKGLNESVSDWIKKHVQETPLCILTPIFKDYEQYLKEMQDEYHSSDTEDKNHTNDAKTENVVNNILSENSSNKLQTSLMTSRDTFAKTTSIFAPQVSATTLSSSTAATTITNTTPGFSFGVNTTTATTNNANLIFNASSNKTNSLFNASSTNTPFSFGTGKPFSFSSNIQKPAEPVQGETEDDEPPKVEYTPVVEENSVYEKRCKIFEKKNGNFVDKGVGTLYIKKIEESGKNQLLVRANTNLGNVLLNLILSSGIPTQRMGKNNVMMVCIPTPETNPPPTPVLIRVKTSEEADELLETLNKYKV